MLRKPGRRVLPSTARRFLSVGIPFLLTALASPPPRGLTAEQVDLYQKTLIERAAVLREKAWRFYDEGVSFAVRVQWHGEITERMKRRRDALAIEAGR